MLRNGIFGFLFMILAITMSCVIVACGANECREVQLMGAGERIHDSFTFANTGVVLEKLQDNNYLISGSVDYLDDARVKNEFDIDDNINHVVVFKLCNCSGNKTVKNEVEISIDGVRNYDAEHLNGDDYTYVILEAVPSQTVNISVKWNEQMQPIEYKIKMADNLELLTNS